MACGRIAFLAISTAVLSSVVMATDYVVGDGKGWTTDFNYAEWTKDKVFRVDDRLVFNYDASKHNVIEVNGGEFQNCYVPTSASILRDGKDTIALEFPGRRWYISGTNDDCSAHQMKLLIDIVPASAPTSAAHVVVSSIYGILVGATIAIATISVGDTWLVG